ncbi:MAG: tetratricopeptide repeat protein [Bacteroidota bacterium]
MVFHPVITNDFVNIDDPVLITENPVVLSNSPSSWFGVFQAQAGSFDYKPITYITWKVEYALFGANPIVFHTNNLLLHILNTCLTFLLVSRMLTMIFKTDHSVSSQIGFWVALVFAVHPLKIESVAWAAEREDVLFVFFYLMGLLAFLKLLQAPIGRRGWLMAIVALFLFSTLSNLSGVTFPMVLLLLYLWYPERTYFRSKTQVRKLIIGIVISGLVVISFAILLMPGSLHEEIVRFAGANEANHPERLNSIPLLYQVILLDCFRLVFYGIHFLLPINLSIIYPKNDVLEPIGHFIHLAPLAVLVGVFVLTRFRRSIPVLVFSFLFFLITISPILLMPVGGTNFLSDRYLYLPSLGLSMALVYGLYQLMSRFNSKNSKFAFNSVMILLVAVSSFLGWQRTSVWKNSGTLFTDLINKFPKYPIGYNNRATYYLDNDQENEAIKDLNKALEYNPIFSEALINRGVIHLKNENYDKAIIDFSKVITVDPENSDGYAKRGTANAKKENFQAAFADFGKAIELNFYVPDVYVNKGELHLLLGQYDLANQSFTAYLNLFPQDHEILYKRGLSLERLEKYTESIFDFNSAINMNQEEGKYYLSRSQSYFMMGDNSKAFEDAKMARKLGTPVNLQYYDMLKNELQ